MADSTEMPFGVLILVGPSNHDGGAYGRHMGNTIKRSVLVSNVGCCYHCYIG